MILRHATHPVCTHRPGHPRMGRAEQGPVPVLNPLDCRRALRALAERDVIPIGNENDTVATDEIKIGDNDTLGAAVAKVRTPGSGWCCGGHGGVCGEARALRSASRCTSAGTWGGI